MLYWLALSTKSNTIREALPSLSRMPRPSCWVYSTLDMVGRAINSTSVCGQSQPSLSRSQAHKTLISPVANCARCSCRSDAFIPPDTAQAAMPSPTNREAISSACFTLAQNNTVLRFFTYCSQVFTMRRLRSGT
ncbi:hypothetical protein SDC9_57896 [bioreactor metagenome]|uniref:Uncharacterized protein n=1 Tax=bioreactor metagenome TaxID=1076179 RepID=A0A644X5W1_9ZZZZ